MKDKAGIKGLCNHMYILDCDKTILEVKYLERECIDSDIIQYFVSAFLLAGEQIRNKNDTYVFYA